MLFVTTTTTKMLGIRLKNKALNTMRIYRVHRQTPFKHKGKMDVWKGWTRNTWSKYTK